MPNLITDSAGIPSPQYLKRDGSGYESSKGINGAFDTNVLTLPALVSGTNVIGKIQLDPANNIIKYIASCNPGSATELWKPASGKKIVLKGIRLQNYTVATATVAEGFGSPDAQVFLKRGSTNIMRFYLEGKHFLEDTTDKIFFIGGSFGVAEALFGDGLILGIDEILNITSELGDVTVSAWGFEI